MGGFQNEDANEPRAKPAWVPEWCPEPETLQYVSSGLTAALLVLVAGYLVFHFASGKSASSGATTAAGVGVGGAGT